MAFRQWALIQGRRDLHHQFWTDARQLPRPAWRSWLVILLIGAAITAGASLVLVWLVRPLATGPYEGYDKEMLWWVVEHVPIPFSRATWLSATGDLIFLIPTVLITVTLAIRRRAPLPAATMAVGYILISALLWVGWLSWDRARPDLIAGGIAAAKLHSFPSGHLMVSVPVYGLLCYFWLRCTEQVGEWLLAVTLTTLLLLLMGLSRLVLGVHWPSDVVAGTLLGLIWLAVLVMAMRRAEAAMRR
jgi:membrane-associated phospholipid phosphatase